MKWITNDPGDDWNFLEQMEKVGARSGVWVRRFPALAAIPENWEVLKDSRWLAPEGSTFQNNRGWGNARFAHEKDWVGRPDWVFGAYEVTGPNAPAAPPLFASDDLAHRLNRPVITAPELEAFESIDLVRIGLRTIYSVDTCGTVQFASGSFAESEFGGLP